MKPLAIVASSSSSHQRLLGEALVSGFKNHGVNAFVVPSQHHARQYLHISVWGWRLGQVLAGMKRDVLVMERAYLGDRFRYFSLGWNGLNGRADFGQPKVDLEARFQEHFSHLYKPWDPRGSYVLLCGQVPGDAALGGRDLRPWYAEKARAAAAFYGLPVRFRPHPLAKAKGINPAIPGAPEMACSYEEALEGARVVVTFSSNSGVDALMAGKPTVAFDEGSMTWGTSFSDFSLDDSEPAGRLEWAQRLSGCQWLPEEVATGAPLAGLLGPLGLG